MAMAVSAMPARRAAAMSAAAAPPRCLRAAAPVTTRRGGRGPVVRRVVSTVRGRSTGREGAAA
eukprot:366465-Chlamydomonas_euryale.AAC.17